MALPATAPRGINEDIRRGNQPADVRQHRRTRKGTSEPEERHQQQHGDQPEHARDDAREHDDGGTKDHGRDDRERGRAQQDDERQRRRCRTQANPQRNSNPMWDKQEEQGTTAMDAWSHGQGDTMTNKAQQQQQATRLRNWEVYHIPSTVANDVTKAASAKDTAAMERLGRLREFGATHPSVKPKGKCGDTWGGDGLGKRRAELTAKRKARKETQ